jgi:hypothetical protein
MFMMKVLAVVMIMGGGIDENGKRQLLDKKTNMVYNKYKSKNKD